jgi:subtilisin family serine protease
MEVSDGRPEIKVGIIDGPVALSHYELRDARIENVGKYRSACAIHSSVACEHGTFVAGILFGKRAGIAPGICHGCTLLVRPIWGETNDGIPGAKPEELAVAITDTVDQGAKVVNISAGIAEFSVERGDRIKDALDYAAQRDVLVVVAAGNQGTIGSSPITRHHWVIPVVCCDSNGAPTIESNLGRSLSKRGLSVPAQSVTSLNSKGGTLTFGGTSAAAPFVTGTIALLLSTLPMTSGEQIKSLLIPSISRERASITPPMLDAWRAYESYSNRIF